MLILLTSCHHRIHENLKPEDFIDNDWNRQRLYFVQIAYYDGRKADTALVFYSHAPDDGDIFVWGTEGAYGSHQLPKFYSSSSMTDTDKIYLGVKTVKVILKF